MFYYLSIYIYRDIDLQKSAGLWYGGHLSPVLDNAGKRFDLGPRYSVLPAAKQYTESIFSKRSAEGWWIVATSVLPPLARPFSKVIKDVDEDESRPL